MNSASQTGRGVVVTGAATGIGFGIAKAFAAAGCSVALLDRSNHVIDAAQQLGPPHTGFVVDVAAEDDLRGVAARINDGLWPVDVLVNNAGVGLGGPAVDLPTADWDTVMATNLRAPFLCAKIFGANMLARGWGRVVNIASQNATCGLPNHLAYSTSKAGLLGMTRVLAVEWGPQGVTANAVSPTYVETDMTRDSWPDELKQQVLGMIPVGRAATPEDIAAIVVFLSTDAAGMINGQNILVDGGCSITS